MINYFPLFQLKNVLSNLHFKNSLVRPLVHYLARVYTPQA